MTETMLVVPAPMLLVMLVVQATMWWHGQQVMIARHPSLPAAMAAGW